MDSLWQADVYKFRLAGVRGHIYVHTVLDDRPRFLVMARAYRRERSREATNTWWWRLKKGRTPKALYVDNGNCFISKEFRECCGARGISVIYGRPYNPRGRGMLERFHGILTQELVGGYTCAPSATSVESSTSGGAGTTTSVSTEGSGGELPPRSITTPN